MSATQERTGALTRVTAALAALTRVRSAAAERPPVGLVAEVAHLERVVEAWSDLADASKTAADLFMPLSPPYVGLMTQHTTASAQADQLGAELAVKQAEVERRLARVRGER